MEPMTCTHLFASHLQQLGCAHNEIRRGLHSMSSPSAHSHEGPDGYRRQHHHEWHLPDGTGLHAPIGVLVRDEETGKACCHVCGEFFTFLGAHIRSHGYSAVEYRSVMGLGRTTPLTEPLLSSNIARRQKALYEASSEFRSNLAAGHEMARRGHLTAIARRSHVNPRLQAVSARNQALAQGRVTRVLTAERDAAERLGVDDLLTWLAERHRAGMSLAQLGQLVARRPQWVRARVGNPAT